MIKRQYKVNILRTSISSLRKQLKEDKQLNSHVSKPPESDKISTRVNIRVKANVQGNTEIELIEHTIKFNDGVIIGTNHTGKLSKKTEFVEDIKKNWFKLILLYAGLVGTNVLTRLPNLDSMTIMYTCVLCIVVTFVLFL